MKTKNISDIDKNFAVKPLEKSDNLCWYSIDGEPFSIHGIIKENGAYCRMPAAVAETVSSGVAWLNCNTAGGRVRFKTDATAIAIRVKMPNAERLPHMPLSGSAGFDLYVKVNGREQYLNSYIPPIDTVNSFEICKETGCGEIREYTLNFPIFSGVTELLIGIPEEAQLQAAEGYKISKPIVYYGSSITHGGCASRPGNSYQSRISRELDCDYLNLGFSGSAKGELQMSEYISGLEMTAFVYDYDYNAPSLEHLKNTHKPFFDIIRKAHPDIPIIMLSRPQFGLDDIDLRQQVIKETYCSAVEAGDNNVYFIGGSELMKYAEYDGTVDNCHPNDLGFYSISRVLGDKLSSVLLSLF